MQLAASAASAVGASEPHNLHTAATAAADSGVSPRLVPSVSQLLDWLSLLCDAQVGLLALGGGEALRDAGRLVHAVSALLSRHFQPAASAAKQCHALAKAIQQQQQQQQRGRGNRQRATQSKQAASDVSQTAYCVEYISL